MKRVNNLISFRAFFKKAPNQPIVHKHILFVELSKIDGNIVQGPLSFLSGIFTVNNKRAYKDLMKENQSKLRLVIFANIKAKEPEKMIELKINQHKARLLFLIIEKYLKIKHKSIKNEDYRDFAETLKIRLIKHFKAKLHDVINSKKYRGLEDLFDHLIPKNGTYIATLIRHQNQIFILPSNAEEILPKMEYAYSSGLYTDIIYKKDVPWLFSWSQSNQYAILRKKWFPLLNLAYRKPRPRMKIFTHFVLPIIPEHPRLFDKNRDLGVRSILVDFYLNLIKIINSFNFRKDEKLDKISLLSYCKTMFNFLNPHFEPLKYPASIRRQERNTTHIKTYKKHTRLRGQQKTLIKRGSF